MKTLNWIIILTSLIVSSHVKAQINITAEEQEYLYSKKTIKIGVIHEPLMPFWGGYFNPSGIFHKFSLDLSSKLEVKTEYVAYRSFSELFSGLSEGEVDITVGFQHTEERESKFFISNSILENSQVIWVRDKSLLNQPYHSLRWVCITDSVFCDILEDKKYSSLTSVVDTGLASRMLKSGVVDATISDALTILSYIDDTSEQIGKIIYDEKLKPIDYRVLTSKKQPILSQIIDKLIIQGKIKEAYEKEVNSNPLYLNDKANIEYILHHSQRRNIRYTIDTDSFPLSFNSKSNNIEGYIHDLLERISTKSVLTFEYVPSDGRDVMKMLKDGEVDLLPARNIKNIDLSDFATTNAFSIINFSMVESTALFPSGEYAILDTTGTKYHEIKVNGKVKQVKIYKNENSLTQDIKDGKIRYAFIDKDLMNYLVANQSDTGFKPTHNHQNFDVNVNLGMVVRNEEELLLNLIQMTLSTFTPEEISYLQEAYRKTTVKLGVDRNQVIIYSLIGIIIALISIFSLLIWGITFRSKVRELNKDMLLSNNEIKWLNGLLNSLPNLISITDSNGKTVFRNNAYKKYLGACDTCLTATSDCLVHPKTLKLTSLSQEVITPPGQECHLGKMCFHITQYHIKSPKNNQRYLLTSYNDVTELKQKELELIEANKKANTSIESRNLFLAVISHELRTPIAALLGLLEMLSKRVVDSESKLLLSNAISSADRLKYHVNDILDITKMEAKQLQLDISSYRIDQELGPLLRSFEASAKLKGLDFVVNWQATELLEAEFDSLRMNQILTNILSNAVKFTDTGTINTNIIINEHEVTFEVKDTGCGIANDQIEGLFQPFVQADKTITRRFGGTGLGMSIVNNLVTLMEGSIEFNSVLGQGTDVKITLPIKTSPVQFMPKSALVYSDDEMLNTWLHKWNLSITRSHSDDAISIEEFKYVNIYPDLLYLYIEERIAKTSRIVNTTDELNLIGHILVADDAPINRLLLNRQLKSIGVTATFAADGLEALDHLKKDASKYDLLLTDCHMPNMDGFNLAIQAKKISDFEHKPIIGCTAESSKIAAQKASEAGIDDMIYKPYSLEQLYRVLSQYLPKSVAPAWLLNYSEEDRHDMAKVVVESLSYDINQLRSPNCDLKALAHRIKGAAYALSLTELASIATQVEAQTESENLSDIKLALINAVQNVIDSATIIIKNKS
ncbi:ATP-binding protein [Shewanella marisflavi]|uniref:ATP-binding protein n=1 Tax=Shewanella marisflavi TaxID=260364 RepID=UPI003AABEF3C